MASFFESEAKEIIEGLRDQATALSEGPMFSTVQKRIEWRAAELIEALIEEAEKLPVGLDEAGMS